MPQRTSINVMSFLQHYRMHPCLWNRYHPHFKNRNARDQAEAVLLPISGVTNVKELRQKIRNIRCTYNQELAKIRRSINSGSAEIYEPKLVWFAFADSFLRVNHIEKFDDPETHSFYGSSGGQMESNGNFPFIKQEVPQDLGYRSGNPYEANSPQNYSSPEGKPSDRSPVIVDTYSSATDFVETVEAFPQSANSNNNNDSYPSNEFAVFGQHVAAQLQQLPLQEALKLEEEIQSAITRARIRSMQEK